MKKSNKYTPWGKADWEKSRAPGITWYSTPSHGGFHLSPAKMAEFEAKFPKFETFAGGPWFEEDCDWAAVVIAFPEHFEAKDITAAEKMVGWSANNGSGRDGWLSIAVHLEEEKGVAVL